MRSAARSVLFENSGLQHRRLSVLCSPSILSFPNMVATTRSASRRVASLPKPRASRAPKKTTHVRAIPIPANAVRGYKMFGPGLKVFHYF